MFLVLLATLLAINSAYAIHLTIEHESPDLKFFLPLTDTKIKSVVIHYVIGNVDYSATAEQKDGGWEYKTSDKLLPSSGDVKGFAEVYYDDNTVILKTPYSHLSHDKTSALVNQGPPRRLRGVAYFRDDFNGFSHDNWNIEVTMTGGWNGEFQVYTNDPKNVYTQNGNLMLKPIPTVSDPRFNENFLHTGTMDMKTLFGYCSEAALNGCTRHGSDGLLPPVMSGKVMSVPTMKYGILEVRARVPKGNWLWPGIWMLPKTGVYGISPRSGEIDIMEYYDFLPHSVYTTLHWGPSGNQNGFLKTKGEVDAPNWHDSFHTWRLEWTPDHIVIFLDNKQVVYVDPGSGGFWKFGGFSGTNIWQGGAKMAPFDQPFYLILNVAVGGTSGAFPDGINYGSTPKPWQNNSPKAAEEFWNAHNQWLPSWQGDNVALEVDYVEFRNL